jgi:amidohydrolase
VRGTLIATRRDFSMHPELSDEEARTAQVIAGRLQALGLAVETDVGGGHGVVGMLQGARPGPVVAYRADMDALPVQDALEAPYRSLVLGVKHACGHDAHVSIALGVAEVLTALREDLAGAVKFIFQPAEESLDGARAMIEAGVLESPAPEAILALHVFPVPAGKVGIAQGVCLAGMDEFRVRLYSPAGNLAALMAKAASALCSISTGEVPTGPAAFDALVRSMQSGDAQSRTILVSCWPYAVEPSQDSHLLGLVSATTPVLRRRVHRQIRQTLDAVTAEMGATYDLSYTFFNPPLINDADVVAQVLPVLERILGPENVLRFQAPYPFAHEDFALYLQYAPGALFWLGIANPEKGITSMLHAPAFDVDEEALVVGTRVMAAVLWRFLEERGR